MPRYGRSRRIPAVLDVLRMLYGREPIPFQTLNFLVRHRAADAQRHDPFLVAAERLHVRRLDGARRRVAAAGTAALFPGSHRLPEFDYEDLGVPPVAGDLSWDNPNTRASYTVYEERIEALARANGFRREELDIKRGTFLIWSANLLHGGSPRDDRTLTRKSQVTHYYFADAVPFTPMFSRRSEGRYAVRRVRDIRTGTVGRAVARRRTGRVSRRRRRLRAVRAVDGLRGCPDARARAQRVTCRESPVHARGPDRPQLCFRSSGGRAPPTLGEPGRPVSDAQTTAIDRARERLSALKVRL